MTPQHHNQASPHHARTWVRLCAAGLIGLSAPVATAAMLGMSPQAVAQIPEETPEQRCQRETQQYNQAQAAAWQATHPGQAVPTPPPWPPYVCVGGPQIDAGAPAGGGAETRPDRWDGQPITGNRPQGWSDTGVGVGAPRTGIARTPADPTAPSALESARSNITQPVAQVTIDTGDGGTRQVIAAGDGPRRIVVDAAGRTTGQILAVTSDGQARIIADESVPAGIDADDAIADGGARATIGTDGDDAGEVGQARTDDVDVVAAEVTKQGYETAAMAAAAAAAAAGALAAAAGLRGGRHARTLPRVIPAAGAAGGGVPPTPWAGTSAQFGWIQPDGDRQRFVVMSDENSARDHRFDMDVPDGGQMVKNPDGSVDVVDADGTVVDHVKAPWAYDAAGRPVDTWYEVDNDTGELVQHVAPDESTVFPIIADPEQSKTTASKKSKTQSAKKSQSNVIDPKTRAAMDRSQAGKNAADKQKAKSKPQPKPAPKTAPKQKAAPKPATTQKPAAAPAKTAAKQTAAKNPAPAKAAPKETPQQQKANDAQRAQRQPGFVGPVTAEDKAGQKRNQQRIDNNKHAAVSAGNNDPAKIPDTDTTKPVQATPSTPRPTPSQAPNSLWDTQISQNPPKHFNSPDPNSKPKQTTTSPSELEKDRTLESRQPGFIGPVTAEDRAGQERNRERQRVDSAQNAAGIAGFTEDGLDQESKPTGKHGNKSSGLPNKSGIKSGARNVGKIAGPAANAYEAVETIKEIQEDPDNTGKHAGEGVGAIAGGAGGAIVGAKIGTLGGPAAAVTIPAGAVIGGIIGSTLGTKAGGAVGSKTDDGK